MTIQILNGDALYGQKKWDDQTIVFRECLMEGPVEVANENEFWSQRNNFFKDHFEVDLDYPSLVEGELEKLKSFDHSAEAVIWFEYDVFCQVNMWFLVHFLITHTQIRNISWAHPHHDHWVGFAILSPEELSQIEHNKLLLSKEDLDLIDQLWLMYRSSQIKDFNPIPHDTPASYELLKPALDALKDLYPDKGKDKISMLLEEIIDELSEPDFRSVFRVFSVRGGIYGLGDLQVKKRLEQMGYSSIVSS